MKVKDEAGVTRFIERASNADYEYIIITIPEKRSQYVLPVPKLHWDTLKELINEQEI